MYYLNYVGSCCLHEADQIDLRRYQIIESLMSGLTTQLDIHRSATYTFPKNSNYSFLCGSMLLGTLTKRLDEATLFSPRPEIPFLGKRFDALCVQIVLMQSEMWLQDRHHRRRCNIHTALKFTIDSAFDNTGGLELRDKVFQARESDLDCDGWFKLVSSSYNSLAFVICFIQSHL